MRVIYIKHSGFLLELEKLVLVFDFSADPAQILNSYENCGKPVVFFVSHRHYDHWNPDILMFRNNREKHYICDQSLREEWQELGPQVQSDNLHFVHENSHFIFDELKAYGLRELYCLPSTDEGVAFYIRTDEGDLYHAGDLNDWDWQDGEGEVVESRYRGLLEELSHSLGEGSRLRLAFVPVDARLAGKALSGARIFCEYFLPEYLVPMHLNGGDRLPEALSEALRQDGREVIVKGMITPGACFDLPQNTAQVNPV